MSIRELIQSKPARERANIKGQEISKNVSSVARTARKNYDIEIVEVNPIEKGVEVYARAWHKNGEQIGFGEDGTVDLERFVIINPPLLVPDPQGEIVFGGHTDNLTGDIVPEQRYREDPKEALLQVLEHNFSIMKNIHGDEKIVQGKIGNTTTTVFPDEDPESTTVDGRSFRNGVDETFATIRSGAGTGSVDNEASGVSAYLLSSTTTDQFDTLQRGIFLFDTSGISPDEVDSATFSLWFTVTQTQLGSTDVDVVSANPASDTAIASGDYDVNDFGGTRLATGKDISGITTGAYSDFSLNASGISNINTSGISKFGLMLKWDLDNNFTGSWGSSNTTKVENKYADETGTTNDPKLVVEHSAALPPLLALMGVGQ